MRQRLLLGTLATVGFVALSLNAMAQVPPTLSLQGDLTNAQAGLSTSPSITFRLYSSASGGTALWTETQTVPLIPNGQYKHFSVILGNTTSLNGIAFDQQYWVGLSVNGGAEITPRYQLPISPYAVRSHYADSVLNGLADGSVTTAKLANGSVTSAKIADSTIVNADVSPTAAISYSKLNLTNSIANGDLTANSVTTSKVANGTVTTSKLADSAVSGLKLLTFAVTNRHLAANSVSLDKVDPSGATSGQVIGYNGTNIVWTTGGATGAAGGDLSGTYPNPTVANNAITSAKIADSTITSSDISATAAIPYSKLTLTNSIQNGDIVANAITTSKVANGTVTTSKLADSAVSGLKLLTYAVTNRHLAANSVTLDKVDPTGATSGQVIGYNGTNVVWTTGGASGAAGGDLSGTYPNPTVANNAITSAKIADSTITDADISATAAIAYSKLSLTNKITNSDITANAITTSKVANGTITTSKMADSAVSGLKLLTYSVTDRHIADGAVTLPKINPTGATSGQVIGYNGTSVVWTTASGGLTLPYSQSASAASPLLDVTQTGASNVGSFVINNSGSTASVLNLNHNGLGNGLAIQLSNASNGGRGIDVTQSGVGPGVFATSAGGNAVWGVTSSISAAGVIGDNTFGEAVVGRNRGGNGVGAIVGRNDSSGYGVRGFNTKNGYGVLGQAGISGGTGTAGRFENVNAANTSDALQVVTNSSGNAARFTGNVVVNGNLTVSGTVAKGGGSFMIDHPLDPQNKILYHSFVESPDMKNIYDGVTKLDDNGEAVIELPNWFMALNGDFRYQLTAIGAQAPGLYVSEEVKENHFKVAGGKPGMKVSWQVTGIRHDPYAVKHPIVVEVEKSAAQRGTYLQPDSYGVDPQAPVSVTSSVNNEGQLQSAQQQQTPVRLPATQPSTKAPARSAQPSGASLQH